MMPSDVQASGIVAICTGGVPPPEWFDVGRSRSICCCETSRKRLTPQRFGFPRRDNTACGLAVACTLHEARMRPANYIDPKPLPLCPVTLHTPLVCWEVLPGRTPRLVLVSQLHALVADSTVVEREVDAMRTAGQVPPPRPLSMEPRG
jgi:hypothetical protein